ncbi:replication factor C subunit 2 [Pelomyxa schiedti]|nr:replication factor C subunit 2 [Pelomyxa schiedti]
MSVTFGTNQAARDWFFLTCPAGLEFIAERELSEIIPSAVVFRAVSTSATVEETPGAVIFHVPSDSPIELVYKLRCADNVFAFVALLSDVPEKVDEGLPYFENVVGAFPVRAWEFAVELWKKAEALVPPKPQADSSTPTKQTIPLSLSTSPPSQDNSGAIVADSNVTASSLEHLSPPQVLHNPTSLSFRGTCVREGTHNYTSTQIAANVGAGVIASVKWKVNLKFFDVEVYTHVIQAYAWIGLSLTHRGRKALFKRNRVALGRTSLKPSIAYGMLRAASITDGDFVCDPMCGCGTIPIEGAIQWPRTVFLGADIEGLSVEKAAENQANLRAITSHNLEIARWDATRIPLRTGSLDIVLSDMPYGVRCGNNRINRKLYPAVIREFIRVVRPEGRVIFLTSERALVKSVLDSLGPIVRLVSEFKVDNSGISTSVYVLTKQKL